MSFSNHSSTALLDLSERAKFKLTGEDRLRFLNGQLTNDIVSLQPCRTLYACALTAKGKLCADLFVTSFGEAVYIDAPLALQSSLFARLERYIIADDVLIEDVTYEFGLFHFLNWNAEELLGNEGVLNNAPAMDPAKSAWFFASESNRFAAPGVDLWFPLSSKTSILETLEEKALAPDVLENLRIERGIAAWGNELSEDVIPNEAGLQERAISYTKGCYLGQEVISRLKSIGHVNRHMRGLVPLDDISLERGDKLISDAESMKEVGSITSAGRSEKSGRAIALGYVKRGFDKSGTALQLYRNNTLIGTVVVHGLPLDQA